MEMLLGSFYLIVIGCVIVSMAVLILKGRRTGYNRFWAGCQACTILWCFSQLLLLLGRTVAQQRIAYLIGNSGICFIGCLWLMFAYSYSSPSHKLPKWWPVLATISVFHLLCMATNPLHHLYYSEFAWRQVVHGLFFYTNVIYSYICVVTGAVMLCLSEEINRDKNSGRAKGMIALAAVVPLVMNLIQLSGILPSSYDITALGFGVSTILVLLATIRYRFLDVNILAFESIIHALADGVAVFVADKMTYSNPAFWEILQRKEQQMSREDWETLLGELPDQMGDRIPHLEIQTYEPGDKMTIYVLKDVSEYYALLKKEKELSVSREQYALARDRNRIAQQVHDTTGHTLVMIQSLLKLALLEGGREHIEQARVLAQSGLKELRESINQLREEEKAPLITQAIMQLTGQVKEIEVEVTVQGEDAEKYSYLTRVIYDTLRETITNCLKYADAHRLEVVVRFLPDKLELMMADDGIGCGRIAENNGLRGIRERIEAANGTVRFLSGEGEGFMTRVILPLT